MRTARYFTNSPIKTVATSFSSRARVPPGLMLAEVVTVTPRIVVGNIVDFAPKRDVRGPTLLTVVLFQFIDCELAKLHHRDTRQINNFRNNKS
jgi:hypothetical protein